MLPLDFPFVQYLYQDLALVFPLTIFMGATAANRALSVKRPSGNLLSFANVLNLLIHIGLCIGFQVLLYELVIASVEWVHLPNPDNTAKSYATTALYYFSNFQYVGMAALFAWGPPWKASVVTNWKFTLWLLFALGASLALLYSPLHEPAFFRSDDLRLSGHWTRLIGLLALAWFGAAILWQLALYPLAMLLYKHWRKSGANKGFVFGRWKMIEGPNSKLYHRLRGEFEAAWKAKIY